MRIEQQHESGIAVPESNRFADMDKVFCSRKRAGKRAAPRWYPVLDLSSRTDRLRFHFHPTRHELLADVPHPHPAIPARQRTCKSDRFADVTNARGKAFSIGLAPVEPCALGTVLCGTKIKFPIPPKQHRSKRSFRFTQ
jgi:hypothetical protein